MRKLSCILAIGAVALVVASCSPPHREAKVLYPRFGDATLENKAVHIIDPDPESREMTRIDMDGERAAGAIERYKRGEVEEPEEVRATEGAQ